MSIIVEKAVNSLWITEAAFDAACKALAKSVEKDMRIYNCAIAEEDIGEVFSNALAKWKAARATAAETIAYASLAALFETRSE